MFTKKYVGPVNCASCEKGITNLLGTQADYLAWKRLPFREPQERIARVSLIICLACLTRLPISVLTIFVNFAFVSTDKASRRF
jgi:hypothetical protein